MAYLKRIISSVFFCALCVILFTPKAEGQVNNNAPNNQEQHDSLFSKKHSPQLAALMSAVVPGSGQIYNKKYWKTPIVWAGLATSIYYIDYNQTNYKIFRNAYNLVLKRDTTGVISELNKLNGEDGAELVNTYEPQLKEYLINGRKYYQRYMNLSYIATGVIYFLNIVDAMVDAHFYYYDISDDVTMKIQPSVVGRVHHANAIGFNCAFTF
ncbi:MAG: DUF5683 domain-containing protein [Bacteroidota bacterium]